LEKYTELRLIEKSKRKLKIVPMSLKTIESKLEYDPYPRGKNIMLNAMMNLKQIMNLKED
jgi:hypothetical protein